MLQSSRLGSVEGISEIWSSRQGNSRETLIGAQSRLNAPQSVSMHKFLHTRFSSRQIKRVPVEHS